MNLTVTNGNVSFTNHQRFPSVATFQCQEGTQPAPSDPLIANCLTTGLWDSPVPTCTGMVMSNFPFITDNSNIQRRLLVMAGITCPGLTGLPASLIGCGGDGMFGDSCDVQCAVGYEGNNSTYVCSNDRVWAGSFPACTGAD